ncbi:peptidoglycan-binding domain-containing protein [Actinoplanes sp. URMC 104]|uniref:peptidoglycan-binding domain-containing protein n=1 Tax=Actinoplanes sp. URMC 104 TaxID=3423409 RepID=UPI003F1B3C82
MRRYGLTRRVLAALSLACALVIGVGAPAQADIESPGKFSITLDMSECDLMYVGTAGSCIISLQTWMNWAVGDKQNSIPIDGLYTEQTRTLVQKFQRKYVPEVNPNGMFGSKSRAALHEWYETKSTDDGPPCNPSLGWGCDIGAAVPGLNPSEEAKVGKSVFCGVIGSFAKGPYGIATGVFCDLTLE